MSDTNVYQRCYAANAEYNGLTRRAASVMLISHSGGSNICYEAAVTFFPYESEGDFRITYDAYFAKKLYEATDRRSKKREKELLLTLQAEIDSLAATINAQVFWNKPISEVQAG